MAGEIKNGMQCGEFDALLSEALDGPLTGEKLESFQAHARVCAVCGPLLAEADAGRRWLKSLDEVEPPVNLVHNILVATTGARASGRRPCAECRFLVGPRSGLVASLVFARCSRWRASRASPCHSAWHSSRSPSRLSLAGSESERRASRRSAAQRHQAHLLRDLRQGREVLREYSLRVYEIESRVREFKRATTPAEPAPRSRTRKTVRTTTPVDSLNKNKNATTAKGRDQPVLASLPMIRL